jgi:hypothetical protein
VIVHLLCINVVLEGVKRSKSGPVGPSCFHKLIVISENWFLRTGTAYTPNYNYEPKGREFESLRAHHLFQPIAAHPKIHPSKQNVPDFTVMGRIARTGSSPEKLFTFKIARPYRDGNGTNGLYNIHQIAMAILKFRKGVVFASRLPSISTRPGHLCLELSSTIQLCRD